MTQDFPAIAKFNLKNNDQKQNSDLKITITWHQRPKSPPQWVESDIQQQLKENIKGKHKSNTIRE